MRVLIAMERHDDSGARHELGQHRIVKGRRVVHVHDVRARRPEEAERLETSAQTTGVAAENLSAYRSIRRFLLEWTWPKSENRYPMTRLLLGRRELKKHPFHPADAKARDNMENGPAVIIHSVPQPVGTDRGPAEAPLHCLSQHVVQRAAHVFPRQRRNTCAQFGRIPRPLKRLRKRFCELRGIVGRDHQPILGVQ